MSSRDTIRERKEPLALTPAERGALSHYYGGMSVDRIAEVMGRHRGTVLLLIKSAERKQDYIEKNLNHDVWAAALNWRVVESPALAEVAEPVERWCLWPFRDRSPDRVMPAGTR